MNSDLQEKRSRCARNERKRENIVFLDRTKSIVVVEWHQIQNIQGHTQATTGKQIKCGVTGYHLNIQLCCDEGKLWSIL